MSDTDSIPAAISPPAAATVPKPVRRGAVRRPSSVLPGLPSTPESAAPPPHAPAPFAELAVAEAPAAEPASVYPPAAVPAVTPAEEATMDTVNTMNDTASTAVDQGRALFADWNSRGKDAMEKGAKAWEELGAFYKGNLEAMVEASRIATKGFESMGQHAAELTRKSLEEATGATRTLSQTKSPTEFLKLQGDLMRSAFDTMVAETSRSTEAVLKLAGDVAQPMANRLAVITDKVSTAA